MSKRTIIAKIELDEDVMLRNSETNGIGEMSDLEYLNHEFGWLEASGFSLSDARIVDEDDEDDRKYVDAVAEIFE